MRFLIEYLCWMRGHGRIELNGCSGRCSRCGYIGMVNPDTGRLFWSL